MHTNELQHLEKSHLPPEKLIHLSQLHEWVSVIVENLQPIVTWAQERSLPITVTRHFALILFLLSGSLDSAYSCPINMHVLLQAVNDADVVIEGINQENVSELVQLFPDFRILAAEAYDQPTSNPHGSACFASNFFVKLEKTIDIAGQEQTIQFELFGPVYKRNTSGKLSDQPFTGFYRDSLGEARAIDPIISIETQHGFIPVQVGTSLSTCYLEQGTSSKEIKSKYVYRGLCAARIATKLKNLLLAEQGGKLSKRKVKRQLESVLFVHKSSETGHKELTLVLPPVKEILRRR